MKKIHISFGDEKYSRSLDLLEKTSLEIGKVDQFIRYTQEQLKHEEFWKKNQFILTRPRGAGYWLWKPYIILETFKNLEDGDVVLYSDAGLKVLDNLNVLFEITQKLPNNGKVIFKVPWVGAQHIAKIWIKRDCFVLTNCDEPKYWNAPMTNGAVSLWVKNEENFIFLNEWLHYLRDTRIVTDDPNMCGKPNFMEFKDHRHDQAVLTLLVAKYNFELFRDPTQWGNEFINEFTNSPYLQLFNHHRNINIDQ
jgi:hypothetical protein